MISTKAYDTHLNWLATRIELDPDQKIDRILHLLAYMNQRGFVLRERNRYNFYFWPRDYQDPHTTMISVQQPDGSYDRDRSGYRLWAAQAREIRKQLAERPTSEPVPPPIVISHYSVPYANYQFCLYSLDPHHRGLLLRKKDGRVRIFSSRASARGTRWRITHGLQAAVC